MRDSNPRMTGPEPVALPLGESPVFWYLNYNSTFMNKNLDSFFSIFDFSRFLCYYNNRWVVHFIFGGGYMKKLLESANFRERLATSIFLAVLIILSLTTVEARGFRFIFVFAGVIATAEFLLTARERVLSGDLRNDRSVLLELVIILIGVGAVFFTFSRNEIILILVSAISNDVLAYFAGNLFHDKFFKTRPFPRTSPKKSWEGVIGGYLGSITVTFFTMKLLGVFNLYFLLLAPAFAIFGDCFDSFTKRILKIKDSNEVVLEQNLFSLRPLEMIMAGHGGYGDRIDSWVAVSTFMFLIRITR